MVKKILTKQLITGFTLIELLVSTVIVGTVSFVGVNLLFTTVLSRSKQNSIQSVNEDIRSYTVLLTESVKNASNVEVISSSEIKTTGYLSSGKICRIFRLSGNSLEVAEDLSGSCNPTGFSKVSGANTKIDPAGFSFVKVSDSPITLEMNINGKNIDSLGEHAFSYKTVAVSRITN